MDRPSDTIAALSTPPGDSGIAVIRISGERALELLSAVFRSKAGARHGGEWTHRRLYHGLFVDSVGETVDEAMFAVLCAPDTYTGDDMVEVSCHGSGLIVSRALEELYGLGARPAEAGEFTRRAFLAGKMDLIQAEAVADLIHARSNLARQAAQRQLGGGLSAEIGKLADEMLGLLAIVEANIDFIEEGIDTVDVGKAMALVEEQARTIAGLLEGARLTRPCREGYDVAIVGPVNVGKSTLFNRLVGEGRAIVTDVPGTTRDVLRETIQIDGVPFTFHDTAGLREDTGDRVESIGMGRSADTAAAADVVIAVADSVAENGNRFSGVAGVAPGRTMFVLNKSDLRGAGYSTTIESSGAGAPTLAVSALTGDGIAELKRALFNMAGAAEIVRLARTRTALNARIAALLESAISKLEVLRESLGARERTLETLAVEARDVLSCYELAVGRKYENELLDSIFSRFCIGK